MDIPGTDMPSLDSPQPEPLPHSRHLLGQRLRQELRICSTALRRIKQARARRRKAEAMTNTREWQKARRARTRLLIEYGGLIVKAGIADLLEDDRASLLGGLYSLCDQLAEHADPPAEIVKLRWRRRGLRAFDEARASEEKAGNRTGGNPASV